MQTFDAVLELRLAPEDVGAARHHPTPGVPRGGVRRRRMTLDLGAVGGGRVEDARAAEALAALAVVDDTGRGLERRLDRVLCRSRLGSSGAPRLRRRAATPSRCRKSPGSARSRPGRPPPSSAVVHPIQAYLDLKGHPERAKEASEELRKQLLTWGR